MTIALGASAAVGRAGWLAPVLSWGESRIWRLGDMTIPAPEPDPDAREFALDRAAKVEPVTDSGVVVLLPCPERDERPADAGAVCPTVERPGSSAGAVRRLRLAAPVQLELVLSRQGPGPGVVWASLPEHSREAVLVLLARLIGSGAIEELAEDA